MRLRKSLVLASLLALPVLAACNDDETLTANAQSNVNQVITSDSEIDVRVHHGVATLSGIASSDTMHARALLAVRRTPGVEEVVDQPSTSPTLTSGTMSR
jgi:osmotically-inducible protein OsmY